MDPYRDWLGVEHPQRPPDHYRLLGIKPLESDARAITAAAQAQLKKLEPYRSGENASLANRVAALIAAAHQELADRQRKAAYDAGLQDRLRGAVPAAVPVDEPTTSAGAFTNQPVGPAIATSPLVTDLAGGRRRRGLPLGPIIGSVGFASLAVLFVLLWWVRGDNAGDGKDPRNATAAAHPSGRRPAFAAVNDAPLPLPADEDFPTTPATRDEAIPDDDKSSASSLLATPSDDGHSQVDENTVPSDPGNTTFSGADLATGWSASPVGRSLSTARLMLQRREMDVAGRTLDQAARLAVTPADFARIARLRMLHRWVRDFWAAFDRNRGRTPAGFQFRAGDTVYTIDEFTAATLKITFDGRQQEYTNGNVPAPVAAALAARKFQGDDPYGKLCVAAFWVVDRDGDRAQAAGLLEEIRISGLPTDALAAELPDMARTATHGAVTSSESKAVSAGDTDASLGAATTAEQNFDVPTDDALTLAEQRFRAAYRAELAQATTAEGKATLAASLLATLSRTSHEPAVLYVMLTAARDLAAEAARFDLVDHAVAKLAEYFDADRLDAAAEAVTVACRGDEPARRAAIERAVSLAAEACEAERFDTASGVLDAAGRTALSLRDRQAIDLITARKKQVNLHERRFEAARKAAVALATDADDPAANHARGIYLCCYRDQWDAGLAHLAKSDNVRLHAAARIDLSAPTEGSERVKLADQWVAVSADREPLEKSRLLARAVHWYALALPELEGLARKEVETKLAELRERAMNEALAGLPREPTTLVIPLGQGVSMTFRRMPAGSYMKGIGNHKTVTEIPQPFYIGVTEVTQAQWLAIAGANPSHFHDEPNQPVDSVTWYDCQKFIELLNATPAGRTHRFRLPTEAEWEYAYRAGTLTNYFFGDDLGPFAQYGWSNLNSGGRTHPVAQLQPNPAGLYDVLGNVWEWTQEQIPRGGGVADTPQWSAVGANPFSPDKSHRTWGFRLVCER